MLSRKQITKEIKIKKRKKNENRKIESPVRQEPGTKLITSEKFLSIADATVQAGQRLRYQTS
jgi:hypothetical protein